MSGQRLDRSMRLARARTSDGTVVTGTIETSGEGNRLRADNGSYDLGEEVTLLAPCVPSALFCVGRNYPATLDRMDYERPEEPDFFIKPPVSVHPPGDPVPYPSFSERVTYAGELAAVIDRECHAISGSEVHEVVRGYTILNDLDALDQPGRTARKAWNGSAPLGPWIETDIDPTGITMETHINGERRQHASTELMLFDPGEVIAYLSERFTFRSGDVIAFGSPANPGTIEPGDEIAIAYEGIGTLETSIDPPTNE